MAAIPLPIPLPLPVSKEFSSLPISCNVTTIAGDPSNPRQCHDAIGTEASFMCPLSLAFDGDGHLYCSDYEDHRIRKLSPWGMLD
jgi:hypothetical protein